RVVGAPPHLGLAGPAHDARHDLAEPRGIGNPRRCFALVEAPVIDELEVEPASASGLTEHVGLELAGRVPRRLPAGGGIEGEDQAPACAWSFALEIGKEGVDFASCWSRRRALAAIRDVRHVTAPLTCSVDQWS